MLQVVQDFKYLGAWIKSSNKDIQVRKALSWNALHSMRTLWKSNINIPLKKKTFYGNSGMCITL